MKKSLIALFVLSVVSLGSAAFAQDEEDWSYKSGGLGVGFGHVLDLGATATGGTGLSVRYHVTNEMGINLVFGMTSASTTVEPDGGGDDVEAKLSSTDIGIDVSYRVANSSRAVLGAFVGFSARLAHAEATAGDVDRSNTDLAFGAGIRPEVWLYDFFSIWGQAAITFNPYTNGDLEFATGDEDSDASGSTLNIFRGDFVGTMGATFWFM